MPQIRLLDPGVSSLIAAGEVIERPASVLKELLENALDAGSTRISVEVAGAGRKLIRVSDDGRGMDPDDCSLCLERHATSKISHLEDLDGLKTFGFRGEALFAVSAVSKVTITSSLPGAKSGWKVTAQAGRILKASPAPATRGTMIEVRDLFFNTPARLKFLRSDSFESSRLLAAFEEAALAEPGVRFSYKTDGRKSLDFPPAAGKDRQESLRKRLEAVLGRDTGKGLASAACDRPGLKAWVFVSPADRLVPTRNVQHWLVNRRPVQSRSLQQALYRAFKELRAKDRHPACVAHIELPPDRLDVNVHPGKREIRFKSEGEVHALLVELIGTALARARATALVGSDASSRAASPSGAYRTEQSSARFQEGFLDLSIRPSQAVDAQPGKPGWWRPPYRCLGQIEGSYLVFEASGGLFVLDQHAAAERIIFEKYLARVTEKGRLSQRLMLPLPVELGASRQKTVLGHKKRLASLGFEIESFGKTSVHVTAAPGMFHKEKDLKDMVLRLLEHLADPGHAVQDTAHDAAATIACKRAVKAHDPLSQEEALRLLEDLKACRDGTACPHGRPTMMMLSRDELARRFDRSSGPPL